ncbi:hypothetical protein [Desulforamulus aeronauticus]|uniref:Uncharacterized protein n=1 Tax=Desulforamulus aeronauticus DSM 10349 TaxID=1121421 RepID=A0A1M6SGV3_9FIRM|nr:hypothetical protein [Desulforamulus aeronauticus]SHK44024.1 hypothetical protein SAMN02745123_01882 [Desulforamulus aeronauticus DSM 10349]
MLIFNFIFQGWPETAAVIFAAFAIVGYKPNLREIISYSLLLVTIIYLFRMHPMLFALHTLVALLVIVLIIYKGTKSSLGSSFFAASSVVFILTLMETLIILLFKKIIGHLPIAQGWLWIMVGWPQIVSLAGIGILIKRIRPIVIKKHGLNEQ